MFSILSPFLLMTAAPEPPARVELPIRMEDGQAVARRFSVTVTINGQPVEAALDTGSVGLRVLAPTLPLKGGSDRLRIGYNSGVEFEGPAVRADVGYATLPAAAVRVQRIDRVACRKDMPQCEAAGVDLASYRIMADRVAGQGFAAILGIGLREDRLGHPLLQAGVRRWIVDLPRRTGETGRLVLNPTDAEVARYKQVQFLPARNEVPGCITTATTRVCGPVMVDTGAPGITLFGGSETDVLPQGTEAVLALVDRSGTVEMPVTIGRRDQAAAMRRRAPRPDAKMSLSFGIAPYLRWSILYDAGARTLGVADR